MDYIDPELALLDKKKQDLLSEISRLQTVKSQVVQVKPETTFRDEFLERKVSRLQDDVVRLSTAKKSKLIEFNQAMRSLTQERSVLESRVKELRLETAQLLNQSEVLTKGAANFQKKYTDDLKAKVTIIESQAQDKLDEAEAKLTEAEERLELASSRLELANSKKHEVDQLSAEWEARISDIKQELDFTKTQIKSGQVLVSKYTDKKSELSQEVDQLTKQEQSLSSLVDQKLQELEETKRRIDGLTSGLESERKLLESKANNLAEKEKTLEAKELWLQDREKSLQIAYNEIIKLRSQK